MSADDKQTKLRYAGICRLCGMELAARTEAIYERSTKTVRCLTCSPADHPTTSVVEEAAPHPARPAVEEVAQQPSRNPDPIDPGTPGASARREYERRQAKRETRIRENHPKLGGLILAMSDDPQSTTAWNTGALGEERLGQRLNQLSSDIQRVLHDRRLPGTRANLDHIAVTPTGIYVTDAKRPKGRPSLKIGGGILGPRVEKLLVGARDQTKLVDRVLKQVDVVRAIVGDNTPSSASSASSKPTGPHWRRLHHPRRRRSLAEKLYPRLTAEALASGIDDLHRQLATGLLPA